MEVEEEVEEVEEEEEEEEEEDEDEEVSWRSAGVGGRARSCIRRRQVEIPAVM